MKELLLRFIRDEQGQDLVEYALLVAAIGLALVVAAATRLPLFPFHGWVRDVYSEAPVGVSVVIAGSVFPASEIETASLT